MTSQWRHMSFSRYTLKMSQLSLLSSFHDQFWWNLVQRCISSRSFQKLKNIFIKLSHDQSVTSYVIFFHPFFFSSIVSSFLNSWPIWLKFGTEVHFRQLIPKTKKYFSKMCHMTSQWRYKSFSRYTFSKGGLEKALTPWKWYNIENLFLHFRIAW